MKMRYEITITTVKLLKKGKNSELNLFTNENVKFQNLEKY